MPPRVVVSETYLNYYSPAFIPLLSTFQRSFNFKARFQISSRNMASALNLQTKVKLNSGYEIPLLGYGLWQT